MTASPTPAGDERAMLVDLFTETMEDLAGMEECIAAIQGAGFTRADRETVARVKRDRDEWREACTDANERFATAERERDEARAERDAAKQSIACWDDVANARERLVKALRTERDALAKERDHWKANHDNAVAIRRAIVCRADLPPDMHPERKAFVATLLQAVAERDMLRHAVRDWTKLHMDAIARAAASAAR